nr:hypothetical protein [Tanacetum cinerariifolium]
QETHLEEVVFKSYKMGSVLITDECSMEDDQLAMVRVGILTNYQKHIVDTAVVKFDGRLKKIRVHEDHVQFVNFIDRIKSSFTGNKFDRKDMDEKDYWAESDGNDGGHEDDKIDEEVGDSLSESILRQI